MTYSRRQRDLDLVYATTIELYAAKSRLNAGRRIMETATVRKFSASRHTQVLRKGQGRSRDLPGLAWALHTVTPF
jgi:hypothetical protein